MVRALGAHCQQETHAPQQLASLRQVVYPFTLQSSDQASWPVLRLTFAGEVTYGSLKA